MLTIDIAKSISFCLSLRVYITHQKESKRAISSARL